MISYGFSIQGKSHVDRGIVCQDAHKIEKLNNGSYIAVIADGVGSAKHSDIGSQIAVNSIVDYCNHNIGKKTSEEEQLQILSNAYVYAFECISNVAIEQECGIEDYDTTLSAVIYNGKKIIFGHAGDGGIAVRRNDGYLMLITKPQKGIDGVSVRPLRAGNSSWEFGICAEEISAVLLVTDGILDGVISPFLLNLPKTADAIANNDIHNVYVTAGEVLTNPYFTFKNKNIANADSFMADFVKGTLDKDILIDSMRVGYSKFFDENVVEHICDSISTYNYPIWAMGKVTDDKTVVALINEKAKIGVMEPECYCEPDWKGLQKQFERLAYPELYNEKPVSYQPNPVQPNYNTGGYQNDVTDTRDNYNDDYYRSNLYEEPVVRRPVRKTRINKLRVALAVVIFLLILSVIAFIFVIKYVGDDKKDTQSKPNQTEVQTENPITKLPTDEDVDDETEDESTTEDSTTEDSTDEDELVNKDEDTEDSEESESEIDSNEKEDIKNSIENIFKD